MFLLGEHKKFSKMVEKMGKMNLDDNMDNVSNKCKNLNFSKQFKRNPKQAMSQLQNALDPQMLKQMGGMGNIMEMVKGLQGGGEGGMGGM